MKPITVIEAIKGALEDRPAVRALFLSGSHGYGLADAYSDIDFLAVAADGLTDEFARLWHEAVSQTGEIVLWWERQVKSMLINAITDEWMRVDVEVVTPDQMARRPREGLKVLFDHDGIFGALPVSRERTGPDPQRMKWQFEEFIRIVGLLPLAIGREEYLNGLTGVFHLRNLLVDLFIEETAAPNRGGALHLNRLITRDQQDTLASLPPLAPTRDAIIAANLAYAATYLPRARKMAQRLGVEWPERFEAATWAHLKKALSIERPYFPG